MLAPSFFRRPPPAKPLLLCRLPTCLLQFDATKADGQHRKPASNAKLLSLINAKGGEPFKFTPFEEAMEESVKWFLENYECVLLALAASVPSSFSRADSLALLHSLVPRTAGPPAPATPPRPSRCAVDALAASRATIPPPFTSRFRSRSLLLVMVIPAISETLACAGDV